MLLLLLLPVLVFLHICPLPRACLLMNRHFPAVLLLQLMELLLLLHYVNGRGRRQDVQPHKHHAVTDQQTQEGH